MKKILVTGGAGFIGSNFIRYILAKYRECHIVNLDKLTYAGNKNNLKGLKTGGRYTFIKGDICDESAVRNAAEGCDAIVNFAAESHVDRSIKEPSIFLSTNIEGTRVLLDAANKLKARVFLQVSTDEVYGSVVKGYSKEESPLRPSSPYAASKAAADLLCLSYHKTYKTPVLITRSANNFGEYQFPEKVMPLFITNALEKKKLPLYADGMNRRDWLYVKDNCAAIDLVLRKGKLGCIYNIGSGNEKTNLRLTHFILKAVGAPKDAIRFVKDRPGHDKRYAVNWSKIKRLGWKPEHDFIEAIEATVSWYKDNAWWWKPLKMKSAL